MSPRGSPRFPVSVTVASIGVWYALNEPIFGKWSDLQPIGRQLVLWRYLHAILLWWFQLSGSFLPPYRNSPAAQSIHILLLPPEV